MFCCCGFFYNNLVGRFVLLIFCLSKARWSVFVAEASFLKHIVGRFLVLRFLLANIVGHFCCCDFFFEKTCLSVFVAEVSLKVNLRSKDRPTVFLKRNFSNENQQMMKIN